MLEQLATQLGTDAAGLSALSFALSLAGGVVAGFGPCILPMIPAIFGYITGSIPGQAESAGKTALRSLVLVGVFILGVAVTSAGIGVLAALLGRAIFVGAWANWLLAVVCLVLGLGMLGVIRIDLTRFNRRLIKRPAHRGIVGAALFGLAFGLVVPPCTTPVLISIATLAATSGSPLVGAGLLFLYGLGRGVPLVLVALFSGVLVGTSWAARATVTLQRIAGVSLIASAAYLAWLAF